MRATKRAKALLALGLLGSLLMLSGCAAQLSERPMEDLTGNEIRVTAAAPQNDGAAAREFSATLYFLSADGTRLSPVVRKLTLEDGMSRAQTAVNALLAGPLEVETGVMWPDLGSARSGRFVEVSGEVATVDLPARARTLPQQTLYAVRMAIARTLTELGGISYVNVLIGGREEGLDLGATLPVGTFTRLEDLDAEGRFSRLLDQRQSPSGVTLLTTLYFPTRDGQMILPEVRSIAYAQVEPIEYLYTLLRELGKGAGDALGMQSIPAPLDYIEEMPEIVRTEDGYVAIELRFSQTLKKALEDAGLSLGVYLAMLTDTLMGFVPGVEGLKISVGDSEITGIDEKDTPNGEAVIFEQTIAIRSDFSGYVAAPVTFYVKAGDKLSALVRPLMHARVSDARARLEKLMQLSQSGYETLPEGLTGADILAAFADEKEIVLNLSERFAKALGALSLQEERAAVYAMVNTLTEDMDASHVIFFFEGEQMGTLAGGLEMRGAFMRNPGMVVN